MALKVGGLRTEGQLGQTIMSHMHHIDGLSTAAAQYQAYLERMRTAHLTEEENDRKVRRRAGKKNFEDELNADEESPHDEEDSAAPEEGEAEEPQASSNDSFGNHYA
jgi:hypothetical protein